MALAGEVATEYGITGWPEGEATQAAVQAFKSWQASRGRGNSERIQVLEQVSGFIDRHGDSRFSNVEAGSEISTRERAGWWCNSPQGRIYLLTAAGFREALTGFDFGRARDLLEEAGALPARDAEGKHSRSFRINGRSVRLYPIEADKLGGDHGA
jgi:putative DNA primase/helicase